METTLFVVEVTETACNCPRLSHESHVFNKETKQLPTLEAAKEWIADRYGKMPNGRRKVYVGDSTPVGFLHSFWNKDWSHNSKNWFQTDWITIEKHVVTPAMV